MKGRLEAGVAIRHAAAELDALRRADRWPAAPPAAPAAPTGQRALPPAVLSRRLHEALVTQDEARSAKVLRAAHATPGPSLSVIALALAS